MRRLFSALGAASLLFATSLEAAPNAPGRAWTFVFTAIDGSPLPLSRFEGQVLLVVNTASFCGFTQQYSGLQALYERYADRGLVVLGVPANDFGFQEPGSNADIASFCQGGFNITFSLAEKQTVKGPGAHPFYRWVAETGGAGAAPRWNFHKVLVGADGALIATFPSQVAPMSREMTAAIEAALAKRVAAPQ
jgi:glutathione peroxidase